MPTERIQHVVTASHWGGHVVHLRFDDGVEGDVDLKPIIAPFTGVLAPLADPGFVARVFVNEHGTITWPGDLDLDPVVLYCAVKGIPAPSYDGTKPQRGTGPAEGPRRSASTRTPNGRRRQAGR